VIRYHLGRPRKSLTVLRLAEKVVRRYRRIGVPEEMLQSPASWPAFSLSCEDCDAGAGVFSLVEARGLGWRDLRYEDGGSFNFVGVCPDCEDLRRQLTDQARGGDQ